MRTNRSLRGFAATHYEFHYAFDGFRDNFFVCQAHGSS